MESAMFTHILLPTDGSEQCRKAIDGALKLARATGCRLTAYTCIEEFPNMAYSAGVGECPHAHYMEQVQGYAKDCIDRIAEPGKKASSSTAMSRNFPSPTSAFWTRRSGTHATSSSWHRTGTAA